MEDKQRFEIGKRIRKYREDCGLSQTELADILNISSGRLSNWEHGLHRPNANIISEICNALNVSPSDILGVHLADDELTEHEREVLKAYREKKELQKAVDILLGL